MGSIGEDQRHFTASTVAIIGAGPSGLAAAKYLIAEKAFSKIVIFEQRSRVGGLWIHTPCDEAASQALSVPQTNPNAGPDEPIQSQDGEAFMSPVYDRLETNIPRGLMGFSDKPWPQECQLFPSHQSVLKYVEEYGAEVEQLISFDTQVLVVRKHSSQWMLTTHNVQTRHRSEHAFDAVVVASGHFNVPYIPVVRDIEDWHRSYPESITHSKFFRRPEDFAGKKVVVVGNSASGLDIGAQIRRYCRQPLIQSLRSESQFLSDSNADQVEKPPIAKYKVDTRTLIFQDGSIESDVDSIVYCTGYLYSLPFLATLDPPLISSGERVEKLYEHIFYRSDPTLSFLVLNQKVIPFPVAEAQSAVIARVLAGRLSLPGEDEMRAWEKKILESCNNIKDFHVLKFPKDADYINHLHDWAMSVEDKDLGKEPPRWDEEAYWTREKFPAIKKTFQALGEERHAKRTLKDIGFDFDDWKKQNHST